MPAGFTVRKRRLVTVAADGSTAKATKKDAARAAKRVAKMGRKRRRPVVTLAA